MAGLFFRHPLVSTPSAALGLSPYVCGLARDCLQERSPEFTQLRALLVKLDRLTRNHAAVFSATNAVVARLLQDRFGFHQREDHIIIPLWEACASSRLTLRTCVLIVEPCSGLEPWLLIAQSIVFLAVTSALPGYVVATMALRVSQAIHTL